MAVPTMIEAGLADAENHYLVNTTYFACLLLRHDVQQGGKGYYDQLRGTLQARLYAAKFNALTLTEKQELLVHIAYFITAVRSFKDYYR